MIDGYKELTPVIYGENAIKYLYTEQKKAEGCYHGTARGFSLCLYCGGIHAMLRKRADKLKIK